MKIENIVKKKEDDDQILTSVKISKEDKQFLTENNIVLRKLVKEAILEIKKIKGGKRQ